MTTSPTTTGTTTTAAVAAAAADDPAAAVAGGEAPAPRRTRGPKNTRRSQPPQAPWLAAQKPATAHAAASIVRNWLILAGQAVTEPRVAELSPHARHWRHPAARQAAVALLAEGTDPTPARVRARTADTVDNAPRTGQTDSAQAATRELAARAPEAAAWVADYRERHQVGPTWTELAAAFDLAGYDRPTRSAAIRGLGRDGWLRHTGAPRSLRPGPRHDPSSPTS